MRTWWTRLASRPRALAAAGAAVVVVIAAITAIAVGTSGDSSASESVSDSPTSSTSPGGDATPGATSAPTDVPPASQAPPDRDEYCPAYNKIQSGGLAPGGNDEEDDQVDLAALGRTFDDLVVRYTSAERVSPLSLRDDYAQALGYLREGQKAVDSRDVNLLKALVTNLDSLNASMSAIEAKSATFCG